MNKNTYLFSVVKNIKGNGPQKNEMKIGPFLTGDIQMGQGSPIWRDKGCLRYANLEKGKAYILFSMMDNMGGIQDYTVENESRVVSKIPPSK